LTLGLVICSTACFSAVSFTPAPADIGITDSGVEVPDARQQDPETDAGHTYPDATAAIDAGEMPDAGPCIDESLIPPRHIFPPSSSVVYSRRPSLEWALPTSNATGARIDICRDRDCDEVLQTFDVTGTSTNVPEMLNQHTRAPRNVFYWRLKGIANNCVGTALSSATWQFHIRTSTQTDHDVAFGSMPDFNGDGYADLTLSTQRIFPRRVDVYSGHPQHNTKKELIGANGFGYTIDSAGDYNGDGFADLLIGSPWANRSDGKAYIYFGGKDFFTNTSTIPSLTLPKPNSPNRFGYSVAGIDDFNRDGYSDIVVSEYGRINIISGQTSTSAEIAQSIHPHLPLYQAQCFGFKVTGVGDINGDGLSDFIATEPSGINGRTCRDESKVHLYLGQSNISDLLATHSFSPFNETNNEPDGRFGTDAAGIGDVNGDGFADFVVARPSVGDFTLFQGAPDIRALPRDVKSIHWNALVRMTVSGLGDHNNDGLDDWILGKATSTTATSNNKGVLVSGSTVSIAGTFMVQYQDESVRQFATIVSGIGDINGDGYNDFIITGDPTSSANPSKVYTDHSGSSFSQVIEINNFPVSAVLPGPH